jgi:hypothetical protein
MPAKPEKEKKRKKIRKLKQKPEKAVKEKEAKPEEKKKYTIPEIFELVKDIGAVLLKRVKKHFKAKIYKINIVLASEEAEKTALLYGAAVQSAYYLFEFLDYNFKIRKNPENIKITPDFLKNRISFDIDIKFYMRLSHVFGLLIASLFKVLKFWGKAGKTEKAET